jgi:4-hydroxy-tetrahydrodipicolinate synthase
MRATELRIQVAARRVPVIAGTGSNSTRETIDFARHAEKAGADAQLVVKPYYNKPTQEGLYQHFKAVHDHSDLPIIVYNIPGRSVVDLSTETMVELAKLPRIIGMKDATGDLSRPLRTRLAVGPDFSLLSGDDATALAFLAQGGHGVISVTSNITPKLCATMQTAWHSGSIKKPNSSMKSLRRSSRPSSAKRALHRSNLRLAYWVWALQKYVYRCVRLKRLPSP